MTFQSMDRAFSAPDPVGSGKPYPVVDVAGAAPTSLAQFSGGADFGIDRDGTVSRVAGSGMDGDGEVRFQEKDLGHSGKDVRVWSIRQDSEGRFTAATLGVF